MTNKQHIAQHKKLHAALLILVKDWQACSSPVAERMPEKRTIRSLIEWSERQLRVPEEVTEKGVQVSDKLEARRKFMIPFVKSKHIPL